jgi:hypothetical protein
MYRALFVSLLALSASACTPSRTAQLSRDIFPTASYRPIPVETIHIVESPVDVRSCRRLAEVSPDVSTTPGFDAALESMLTSTVTLGGTHLYLEKRTTDWSITRGVAYDCNATGGRVRTVIRARG